MIVYFFGGKVKNFTLVLFATFDLKGNSHFVMFPKRKSELPIWGRGRINKLETALVISETFYILAFLGIPFITVFSGISV